MPRGAVLPQWDSVEPTPREQWHQEVRVCQSIQRDNLFLTIRQASFPPQLTKEVLPLGDHEVRLRNLEELQYWVCAVLFNPYNTCVQEYQYWIAVTKWFFLEWEKCQYTYACKY